MDKYLTDNIITYLGNKRKLLTFINDEINKIISNDKDLSSKNKADIKVLDIFSGSGIVSRSFRKSGYTVLSNDLEVYTKPINETFISTSETELNAIFSEIPEKLIKFYEKHHLTYLDNHAKNSYDRTVFMLNSVRDLGAAQSYPYFQLYYSAKDTKNPDFERERIFYTQENGRFIDTVLELVNNLNIFNERAKNIILASLFHKMTTNINTSGTMKGFHNGWGGTGGAALERILGDIMIERIVLPTEQPKGYYFIGYAERFFENNPELSVDIIYADPPYNQHQYSANYHMLTTAYNNRDYDVGEVKKGTRAGIRVDHNRSDFCKSIKTVDESSGKKVSFAYKAFNDFIVSVQNNTKYVVISYNQEGVLDHKEIIDILSQNGKNSVTIETEVHEKYKGGKKTNISNYVIEYLFVVETNKQQSTEEVEKLKASIEIQTRVKLLTDKYLNVELISEKFNVSYQENGNIVIFLDQDNEDYIVCNSDYKIIEEHISEIDIEKLEMIKKFEYKDFDKEKLIEQYLKDKNYTSALKMLSSFKIKKHNDYFNEKLDYIESIIENNEVLKKEINKLRKT